MRELVEIHRLIDEKEYGKSIKKLKEILEISDSNEYLLNLLDYCSKHYRIQKNSSNKSLKINVPENDFKLILDLLKEFDLNDFLGEKYKSNKLSLKNIELIENIPQSHNAFSTFKGLCEILQISPLQYPILYYIASLVKFFKLNKLLYDSNLKSESINLLNLIQSIYDPFEFIKVRNFLNKKGIKWMNLINLDLIDFSKDSLLDIEKKIKRIIL